MKYAQVSVKFPRELNDEIERFINETGIYTNKSEFIKDATRRQLLEFNNEAGIAALRLEQMLARAEANPISDDELHDRLDELSANITQEDAAEAVEQAQQDTAAVVFDTDSNHREDAADGERNQD
jgi:Arc/MetJ-type ribon-helix-helix transcriptional regulator